MPLITGKLRARFYLGWRPVHSGDKSGVRGTSCVPHVSTMAWTTRTRTRIRPVHALILTGSSKTPVQVQYSILLDRNDYTTTDEEADLIIVKQVMYAVTE